MLPANRPLPGTDDMVDAIVFDRLSKTYQAGWHRTPVAALRDMTLKIGEGEAFGFIGPNGAGKSSAIRILMGLSRPTSGSAEIFGLSVNDPAARRGLGYVPETPCLYEYLTPREILDMGVQLHGVRLPNLRQHVDNWLGRLGLGAVSDSPIRSFSKGMLQRVAVAHALAIKPRLLVLDEPLSGLDPIGRMEVVGLLAEYKAQGGTLFFTSHVLHDVERLADRFGLINLGVLRSVRAPAELAGEEDLVLIRSAGESPVDGMTAESAGRWSGTYPRSQIWRQLESLRIAGHQVIELKPSLSLESAFLKVVGK